jgi:hypothetical protein
MTFADKLRTLEIRVVKPGGDYIDREALADTFGPDAKEHYMEETKGLGAAYRDHTGRYMRRGDGNMVPVTDREMADVYLRGPEAEDVV